MKKNKEVYEFHLSDGNILIADAEKVKFEGEQAVIIEKEYRYYISKAHTVFMKQLFFTKK